MASTKTVFVVGAGASFEFGLPVGSELKKEIANALAFKWKNGNLNSGDGYLYEVLQTYKYNVNREANLDNLIAAARYISSSMTLAPSIDNFIHINSGNSEVELCGKLAIAHRILRAEATSKLKSPSQYDNEIDFGKVEDTWLVALMKILGEDCTVEQLPERLSTITFIVFNYDRCIEHFLFNAIKRYYGVKENVAADLINNIAIYHPYGVVGRLPWQDNPEVRQSIDFGGSPSQTEILKVASEIKTFTEGTDDSSSEIIAIRRAIAESRRMVFLGFAYHRLNIELLLGKGGALPKTGARSVFGTAWGMSDHDTESVRNSLEQRLFAPSIVVRNKVKCADLFYEYSHALALV